MGLLDYFGFKVPSPENKRVLALLETLTSVGQGGTPFPYLLQWVMLGHPLPARLSRTITTAKTDHILIAAPTPPMQRTMLVHCRAVLDPSVTNNPKVRMAFGATVPAESDTVNEGRIAENIVLTAGSGANQGDGIAQLVQGSAGQPLVITCDAPVGGAIRILGSYFQTDWA